MNSHLIDVASFSLGEDGHADFIVTRAEGLLLRKELESTIFATPDESITVLDFRHVKFIDLSGSDEVVAKIVSRARSGEYGGRFVALANLTEQHLYNVERALQDRSLAVLHFSGESVSVVGFLNPYLKDTLERVMRNGQITARELADELAVPINTSSTRLLNLYNARLVARREDTSITGNRQYVYQALSS